MSGSDFHIRTLATGDGPALICLGTLGTDSRLWAALTPHMPPRCRIAALDLRGHGGAAVPAAPYPMGGLVRDVEAAMERAGLADAVVLGLGLGGMVAQALAVKRLDLVRGLVLIGTAAKIGTPGGWADWADAVRAGGAAAVEAETLARWYGPRGSRERMEVAREMLTGTPAEALIGCAGAIAGTDMMAATATLRLPTLVLAGSEDAVVPPDLARETAALIPGAEMRIVRGAGHLPPLQSPEVTGAYVTEFLERIAHV